MLNQSPTHRLPVGHEPVAHPASRGAVPADVGEAPLVVAVGRAEGDLLDGLVHDEPLRLVVHHAQAVAVHVQHRAHRLPLRVLRERGGNESSQVREFDDDFD